MKKKIPIMQVARLSNFKVPKETMEFIKEVMWEQDDFYIGAPDTLDVIQGEIDWMKGAEETGFNNEKVIEDLEEILEYCKKFEITHIILKDIILKDINHE